MGDRGSERVPDRLFIEDASVDSSFEETSVDKGDCGDQG